jgi:hypothetical protein
VWKASRRGMGRGPRVDVDSRKHRRRRHLRLRLDTSNLLDEPREVSAGVNFGSACESHALDRDAIARHSERSCWRVSLTAGHLLESRGGAVMGAASTERSEPVPDDTCGPWHPVSEH